MAPGAQDPEGRSHPHPSKIAYAKQITIAFMNVQGMIKAEIRKQLTDYAKTYGIDIFILTETHIDTNKLERRENYSIFTSGQKQILKKTSV